MINKKNLWFITLFSIILVLSIFYVGMNEDDVKSLINEKIDTEDSTLVVNENTELVALRVQSDEEVMKNVSQLQDILLSETASINDKNEAYNSLVTINSNKGLEEDLEKIIKDKFKYNSFVKINGDTVTIVIDSDKHNYEIANNIIKKVQESFSEEKYITVKFN